MTDVEMLERAQRFMNQKSFHEAIETLRHVIRHGDRLQGLRLRAQAYKDLKEYERACDDLSEAIALDAHNMETFRLRALIYNKMGKHALAISDFNSLISLAPKSFDAHHLRGVSYGKLGDYTAALYDLNTAITLKPNSTELFRTRGLVYGHLKQYENALRDLSESVRLDPNNSAALRDRGCIYVHVRDHERAIKDLTAAIAARPRDTEAFHNRALAYYRIEKFESAIADSIRVLEMNPRDGEALLDIAKSYLRLGKLPRAIPYLVDAVKVAPGHAETVKALLLRGFNTTSRSGTTSGQKSDKNQKSKKKSKKISSDTIDVKGSEPQPVQESRNRRRSDSGVRQLSETDEKKFGMPEHSNEDSAKLNAEYLDVDNAEDSIDDEIRRKSILKQMLASQRLKEFRNRQFASHNSSKKSSNSPQNKKVEDESEKPSKDSEAATLDNPVPTEEEVAKLVRARQAVTALEVDRRADQAVRLKRDLDERFRKQKSREAAMKELIDIEIQRWHSSVLEKARRTARASDSISSHIFQCLIQELPKLLSNVQSIKSTCERWGNKNVSPKKAFRQIALEIHPDKLNAKLAMRESLLARAAWCVITEAYTNTVNN